MALIENDVIECKNCHHDKFEEVKLVTIRKDFNKVREAYDGMAIPDRLLKDTEVAYKCQRCGYFL